MNTQEVIAMREFSLPAEQALGEIEDELDWLENTGQYPYLMDERTPVGTQRPAGTSPTAPTFLYRRT
jgi:hypothetical protein